MVCHRCGSNDCQIINEVSTSGKDFSATKGCCGWFMFGPIGLICGSCGEGRQVHNHNYWVCNNCGRKWKA